VSAFRNDFADFLYAMDTGEELEELPIFRYTQDDAELYGFEGEITFPLYQQGDQHFEMRLASDYVRGRLEDGGDLPQMPPLRYGVELHYERGPLHLGAETYRYSRQENVGAHERETPGYTLLDVDMSYRLDLGANTVLLFLRGSNLLDEDARRHPSPLKEVAPLPGRSLHAGVRAEF
jgi:iron complex outermembrane receptor protein